MKNKYGNVHLYIAISFAVCSWYAINAKQSLIDLMGPAEKESSVPSMTPEQLEISLSLDKNDLALDHQLNLNSEIDTSSPTLLNVKELAKQEPFSKNVVTDHAKPTQFELLVDSAGLPLELQTAAPVSLVPQKKHKAPSSNHEEGEERAYIEFNFEDADLQSLLDYVSEIFGVSFITNDVLNPAPKTGKGVKGNKISFKTHDPLTKKGAWDLFLSFLKLAGLTLERNSDPKIYTVLQTEAARKAAIPVYIGVKPETLPDNDQLIRYVYFVENANLTTVKDIVEALRSPSSAFLVLNDLNAFLLTDNSYNIISLMKIITELDRVSLPQAMSVLKLRRADATEVKALYDSITQTDDASIAGRLFPARKQPTALYFPENTRIIAEPRSNALILLGPKDAIKKIEDFIVNYVDVDLGKLYSPLRTYQLKYADATNVATIMNEVTQFGKTTIAGQVGGVRDEDKYLKNISFIPEPATNTLIIKGDEEDYLKAKEIIIALDEAQPQVAIEVLILALDLNDTKRLGTQMRSKIPGINGLVGDNVKFQTSGLNTNGIAQGIQTNDTGVGVDRLLANLVSLAAGASPGNTIVSLGTDQFGVWGIFNILHTVSNAEVVSNPFIITSNKKKASVSVGETRRVVTGQVIGGTGPVNSFGNDSANLTVTVTPQINSDGMIVLDLEVELDNFTNTIDLESATKNTRKVTTSAIVSDKEVLALGGLIQNRIENGWTKVPILGDIPLIGWLFKNKQKVDRKSNLLILISSRIIQPDVRQVVTEFTQGRLNEYREDLDLFNDAPAMRDPIHRWFFADDKDSPEVVMEDYLFTRQKMSRRKKRQKHAAAVASKINKKAPTIEPKAIPAHSTSTLRPSADGLRKSSLFGQFSDDVRIP